MIPALLQHGRTLMIYPLLKNTFSLRPPMNPYQIQYWHGKSTRNLVGLTQMYYRRTNRLASKQNKTPRISGVEVRSINRKRVSGRIKKKKERKETTFNYQNATFYRYRGFQTCDYSPVLSATCPTRNYPLCWTGAIHTIPRDRN